MVIYNSSCGIQSHHAHWRDATSQQQNSRPLSNQRADRARQAPFWNASITIPSVRSRIANGADPVPDSGDGVQCCHGVLAILDLMFTGNTLFRLSSTVGTDNVSQSLSSTHRMPCRSTMLNSKCLEN